ncbi:MAG: hypothetical protein R3F14_16735 [Polyangiaceae bacterium]
MSPASRLVAAAALTCAAACGPSVPVPELATHDGDEPILVPYPPPVPRVELIPPRPAQPQDRLDRRPVDLAGAPRLGVAARPLGEPHPGATYAPPAIVYLLDRRIARTPRGTARPPPPPHPAPPLAP